MKYYCANALVTFAIQGEDVSSLVMNEVYNLTKSNTTEYPKYIGTIQNLLFINDITR
jgi:hypothetical protein